MINVKILWSFSFILTPEPKRDLCGSKLIAFTVQPIRKHARFKQDYTTSITITFVIFVMYKLLVPVRTSLELQRDFKMIT